MKQICDLLDCKGREIWSVSPDATVYEAIERMAEKGVGALLVMSGKQLVGIVSERDYARKVILMGKSSREIPVREIMSHPVISVSPDVTVDQTMTLMTERRVRHLPVVVGDKVMGVISIGDVVRAIIEEQQVNIHRLVSFISATG